MLEAKRSEKIRLELELKNVQRQIAMLRKSGNKVEVGIPAGRIWEELLTVNDTGWWSPLWDDTNVSLWTRSPCFRFCIQSDSADSPKTEQDEEDATEEMLEDQPAGKRARIEA